MFLPSFGLEVGDEEAADFYAMNRDNVESRGFKTYNLPKHKAQA